MPSREPRASAPPAGHRRAAPDARASRAATLSQMGTSRSSSAATGPSVAAAAAAAAAAVTAAGPDSAETVEARRALGAVGALLAHEACAVAELELSDNGIGSLGGVALAKALAQQSSLNVLSLAGNELGPKGGLAFAATLQTNKCLQRLDLSANGLGSAGERGPVPALGLRAQLARLEHGLTLEQTAERVHELIRTRRLSENEAERPCGAVPPACCWAEPRGSSAAPPRC